MVNTNVVQFPQYQPVEIEEGFAPAPSPSSAPQEIFSSKTDERVQNIWFREMASWAIAILLKQIPLAIALGLLLAMPASAGIAGIALCSAFLLIWYNLNDPKSYPYNEISGSRSAR